MSLSNSLIPLKDIIKEFESQKDRFIQKQKISNKQGTQLMTNNQQNDMDQQEVMYRSTSSELEFSGQYNGEVSISIQVIRSGLFYLKELDKKNSLALSSQYQQQLESQQKTISEKDDEIKQLQQKVEAQQIALLDSSYLLQYYQQLESLQKTISEKDDEIEQLQQKVEAQQIAFLININHQNASYNEVNLEQTQDFSFIGLPNAKKNNGPTH